MEIIKRWVVIIIGSGPAGCTASLYLAKANIPIAMLTGPRAGGQLVDAGCVENWPGELAISGPQLVRRLLSQTQKSGVEMIRDSIRKTELSHKPFLLVGKQAYLCESVIVSTGSMPKKLKAEDRGVCGALSYCAVCDGHLFSGKKVLVVGGGDTATADILYLNKTSKEMVLVHRKNNLKACPNNQTKVFELEEAGRLLISWDSEIERFGMHSSNIKRSVCSAGIWGASNTFALDGSFISIGHEPSTKPFQTYLAISGVGSLKTDCSDERTITQTNIRGIFAAGDVRDDYYRQIVTSTSAGCIAALEAQKLLNISQF
ncbi:thioredoxin reductase [Candidatus Tremblaya phenacola PAVE]|nr:thioredoxin reductase [Candidatus Tremblaya phenacola PAVE]